MGLIYFLLRSSWQMVAIAAITGLISGSSSAGLIALISHALSTPSGNALNALLGGFLGLVLVVLITSVVSQVTLVRLSHYAVFELRMRLLKQILAAELSHLEQLGNPRLLATLTEDVRAITNAVYLLPMLCIDVAIVVGCLFYIAWLSITAFGLVIAFAAAAFLSCFRLISKGDRWLTQAREEEDDLFQHFRGATEGVKELKLHQARRQDFLTQDVEPTAIKFRRYNIRGMMLFAAASSWGKLVFFFAVGFVLFALPKLLILNPQAVSGYVLVFIYLTVPMDNISNSFPFVIQSSVALRKIESLGLSLGDRPESTPAISPINSNWGSLKLDRVVYPYAGDQEDSHFALGPMSLSVQPGELVFIVGGNGSGKSTLAKLLTGLYIPKAGELWLDNQLITASNRDWYRQHFSAIFSDFYLFERLLGLHQTDLDRRAQEYLHKLQLEHKVTVRDRTLSTTALSQGQRKRLALLTAYLEDRPIYLFDEWAADQDPIFRDLFYTEFLPNLKAKGKTIFVISHDDHYFHWADRLIKLDGGQIEFDRPPI